MLEEGKRIIVDFAVYRRSENGDGDTVECFDSVYGHGLSPVQVARLDDGYPVLHDGHLYCRDA